MPDQLPTTESQLYERAFPPKDLAYWLGQLLHNPTSGMPTVEDYRSARGEIGLPTETQTVRQTGQDTLDYVTQFLGPLMALMGSRQYARHKSGHPAPTWKDQADYTKANDPLETMRHWARTKPWENRPPEGESAWTYRQPPTIGGPTGRGMAKEDILAAIEKEKFQGMLKQIRDLEAREAEAWPRRHQRNQAEYAREAAETARRVPPRGSDDDLLEAALEQLRRQGPLPSSQGEQAGPFTLPPLPGD